MIADQAAIPSSSATEAQVVGKAVTRAADHLGIPNRALARILGLSEASISRLRAGEFNLPADSKAFELAVLLIRLYRGLDAIVGGDTVAARSWLRGPNTALHDSPFQLIQTVSGLTQTVQYVDAHRARL
ncbi:MbcA/ParS/Xre antitoxin family protein [Acidisoma sp. 7E03]